jgi:hypothetical protein
MEVKSGTLVSPSTNRLNVCKAVNDERQDLRDLHLQPKTAFSRLPPVYLADLEGQRRVDSDLPLDAAYFRPTDRKAWKAACASGDLSAALKACISSAIRAFTALLSPRMRRRVASKAARGLEPAVPVTKAGSH